MATPAPTSSKTTPEAGPAARPNQPAGVTARDGAAHQSGGAAPSRSSKGGSRPSFRILSIGFRIGLGLVILIVAFGIVGLLKSTAPASERVENIDNTLTVGVVRATPVPVAQRWVGHGTARAMRKADITSQVSAEALERPENIEAGVEVGQGDLILQLDPSDFRDRLQSAQQAVAALEAQLDAVDVEAERLAEQVAQADTELELTRSELARLLDARERGAGSEIEVDRLKASIARMERQKTSLQQLYDLLPSRRARLEAEMQSQERQRELARRDVERARIVSPIDGSLERIEIQEGELVAVGQPIARIVDLRRLEVPLRIAASAFDAVSVGDVVPIHVEGADPSEWTARIARIGREVDPGTRTVALYLEVEQDPKDDDGPALLLPGRFVTADVRSSGREARIVVPRNSVTDDTLMVVIEDDEGVRRAFPRRVRVLFHTDGMIPDLHPIETQWAVLAPGSLAPGELVITTNLDELEANTPVRLPGGVGMPAVASDGSGRP